MFRLVVRYPTWSSVLLWILSTGSVSAQVSLSSDAAIEACLTSGKFLKGQTSMTGVTRPVKVELECDGETRSALFKTIDEHRRGLTRLQGAGVEMNFSDDYRYERAAYLLDRELGLEMVPVAVLRSRKGENGALIAWLDHAAIPTEMPVEPTPKEMLELTRQKQIMYLFDALIENTDRSPTNFMIDKSTWRLYLIDHSRAFRTDRDLKPEYLERNSRLNRELYQRLEGLNEEDLHSLLDGLISGPQIKALIARRDAIVAKIQQDIERFGEGGVFTD